KRCRISVRCGPLSCIVRNTPRDLPTGREIDDVVANEAINVEERHNTVIIRGERLRITDLSRYRIRRARLGDDTRLCHREECFTIVAMKVNALLVQLIEGVRDTD